MSSQSIFEFRFPKPNPNSNAMGRHVKEKTSRNNAHNPCGQMNDLALERGRHIGRSGAKASWLVVERGNYIGLRWKKYLDENTKRLLFDLFGLVKHQPSYGQVLDWIGSRGERCATRTPFRDVI